jgi:hypothetical protein
VTVERLFAALVPSLEPPDLLYVLHKALKDSATFNPSRHESVVRARPAASAVNRCSLLSKMRAASVERRASSVERGGCHGR